VRAAIAGGVSPPSTYYNSGKKYVIGKNSTKKSLLSFFLLHLLETSHLPFLKKKAACKMTVAPTAYYDQVMLAIAMNMSVY